MSQKAWREGFTVKSTFAREHAQYVAAAASMQLITTRLTRDTYGSEWQITSKGLRWINERQ